jgi:hypothetical protein
VCGRGEELRVTSVGKRFAVALSAKDSDQLRGLLADEIDFRGMTPGRFWEASSPSDVLDVLYEWFEPSDAIEELIAVADSTVVDRRCVDYRFRVRNDDGLFAVEQRAYYDVDGDGRISLMRVMCSGFRALASS